MSDHTDDWNFSGPMQWQVATGRVPRTWEDAAWKVASEVPVTGGVNGTLDHGALLHEIERKLLVLRDHQDEGPDDSIVYEYWRWLAHEALWGFVGTQMSDARTDVEVFRQSMAHVVETIIGKQNDYGHENITWSGRLGLVIRTHDKVARIRNLEARDEVRNEPLADSWLDLVGYSLIGMMVERGTFLLSLKRDLVPNVDAKLRSAINDERIATMRRALDVGGMIGPSDARYLLDVIDGKVV